MPSDLSLQKLPPQNLEAEQSVLGAILLENSALNKSLEVLSPNDFYKESHRRIFSAILDLSERNDAIDLVTITEHLRQKNELEQVGGAVYLTALVNSVPTAANIRFHSKIIHEKALLRNLIQIATDIVTMGYEDSERVENLLDFAEQSIFGISERKVGSSFLMLSTTSTVFVPGCRRMARTSARAPLNQLATLSF